MMKTMLDTQILIQGISNQRIIGSKEYCISTVAASEFLQLSCVNYNSAKYYIPKLSGFKHRGLLYQTSQRSVKNLRRFKHHTDSMKMDFANDCPTLVYFSLNALVNAITNRDVDLFRAAIEPYSSRTKKRHLLKRFYYLLDLEIECLPLGDEAIKSSYMLLGEFISKYTAKPNFRNTMNDILILASAYSIRTKLITEDKLLNTLAERLYGGKILTIKDDISELDFSISQTILANNNRGSKGYVNNSWAYKIRNT